MSKRTKAKGVDGSASRKHVAEFLLKELGDKDAKRIAAGMESAATAKGMKRRLGKLKVAVASASSSASAAA